MSLWAKLAADEIVSDDAIDEADSEKSSASDWMKWALAASALGAAGFAAWKYSPEIQKALGSTKLYSDKALSNRLIEKIPVAGDMSASPAVWGGIAGLSGQVPFTGALRESVLLGGKDAPLRTIPGQLGLASTAGKRMSGGMGGDHVNAALAEQVSTGLGAATTPSGGPHTPGPTNVDLLSKLYSAGVKTPDSALGKLRSLDFSKLPADWATHQGQVLSSDTGLGRSAAAADLDRIAANSVELDRRLGSSVDYKVPQLDASGKPVLDASGAPILTPKSGLLRDVTAADRAHLAPEHRLAWDAHRHAATEAGAADPAKFRLGDIGKGLSTNRASLRRGFSLPHALRSTGLGMAAGAVAGTGVDLAGKAFE
ncbi:MAG TPA: hypothetical protein PLS53_00295 [Thermoanaerobaculaceae bacterium]|nr:hypothetical protein [Thermoanaerobaculaceae bacterium]HPS76573.1 hypothetical protein [Thermoanaerobaculaceae bacterium]